MPELIFEGHVYSAMPPLYKAMPKSGEEEYLYDDKALEHYRKTAEPVEHFSVVWRDGWACSGEHRSRETYVETRD